MQEYIRAYEISDEHHMPRIIDRDNGPLSGAARLSRGTECHEEYELYVFFVPSSCRGRRSSRISVFSLSAMGSPGPGGSRPSCPGPYLRAEEAPYPQALRRGWAASGPAGPGRPRPGRETRRKSRRPARGRRTRTRRLSRKSTGSSSSPQGLLEALVLGHVRGVCNRANFGRSSLE